MSKRIFMYSNCNNSISNSILFSKAIRHAFFYRIFLEKKNVLRSANTKRYASISIHRGSKQNITDCAVYLTDALLV